MDIILDTYIDFISKYPFEEILRDQNKSRPNLRKDEWQALLELKEDKNLVIKECDKGGACVIMDKQFYCEKMEELLKDETTYKEIGENIDATVHRKIKALTDKHSSELTSKEIDYLTQICPIFRLYRSDELFRKEKEQYFIYKYKPSLSRD